MAISNAVDLSRVSRVLGYKITKGNFNNSTQNLPQRIAVLAEANTANQAGLSLDPVEITTLSQAANLYGYGSPIYTILRILRPTSGGGVGGVPVVVYPQLAAAGSSAEVLDVTPTGTATGNATHTLLIGGREGVEGQRYDFTIVTGDTVATITAKIEETVNSVLGSPMTGTDNTTKATLTSKWTGVTSSSVTLEVLTNDKPVGMTYAVVSTASGAGLPSVTPSLNKFGEDWNTIVLNSYNSETATLDELEAFNGIPDPTNPTGRYSSIVVKPFIALFGNTDTTGWESIMSARKLEVTNSMCVAPSSKGQPMEAAANYAVEFSFQANNNPHLDISAKFLKDMPVASNWTGTSMATYNERDSLVQKGVSTVVFTQNKFQVQDFVTSYRPDGETPPQYRYCSNIMIDLNVFFGYHLLEEIHVIDHAIATDKDIVSVGNVIKPKQWKGIVRAYAADLANRSLIADASFMQESITTGLGTSNPDRLETFFRYKRRNYARILSTTAEAGFNFGTLN
jgi:phage tail sheath gpL-like